MGLQKYRADSCGERQPDGARIWCAKWFGGPTISKIENCRLANLEGDMRRTVYVQGEPDTFFSIPAACLIGGKRITGYLTGEDENFVFRHCYY